MQLSHRIENDFLVLNIEGNVALDGVSEMKSYVKPFLDDDNVKGAVINFSKINFIDSSGIGLVVSIFKTLQQRQAKLSLCDMSPKNLEIFSMTRLDKIINITKTEEEALESLKG